MGYFRIVLAAAIVLTAGQVKGQSNYQDALSKLENEYQQCRDKSNNLQGCSQKYYQQLEGLLQNVQKEVAAHLRPDQKAAFKNEQSTWNQKKTAYFRELPASVKADNEDMTDADLRTAVLDKKAEFLAERINELMGTGDGSGEDE